MHEFIQLLANPVVVIIVGVALLTYTLILHLLLSEEKNSAWLERSVNAIPELQIIASTLPLLGLLGTITGLLGTFHEMASGYMSEQELLSSGIADAMYTTEIGLLMVIPAWLLLARLKQKITLTRISDVT